MFDGRKSCLHSECTSSTSRIPDALQFLANLRNIYYMRKAARQEQTFLLTSKNFATHLSMQTLSPLFKSGSVYRVLTHLLWQDLAGKKKPPELRQRHDGGLVATNDTNLLKISVIMSSLHEGGQNETPTMQEKDITHSVTAISTRSEFMAPPDFEPPPRNDIADW